MSHRFLFTTTPGYGHFHPLVPMARALQARGHAVAFVSRPDLQPLAEAAGFTFFPAAEDRNNDPEYIEIKAQQQTMSKGIDREIQVYLRRFCSIHTRVMIPGVIEAARAWKADMLIRESSEYAGVIAAEVLGIPHITISCFAAFSTLGVFEKDAAQQLDPLRQRWGLPPDPELSALYRNLQLFYAPESFASQPVSLPGGDTPVPPTTRFIRPQFFDQAKEGDLPSWLAELPDQPTIYVTLGTEINAHRDLYPSVLMTIINGLRDLPVNLIVTLGRGKDPADFGEQPANVHIEPYIPQSLILSRCDLMVMHAGSNSLLAAIDAGLPLVIIPLIADQFFNAEVIENVGLGQVVTQEALTSASVRAAVESVLNQPNYREVAQRFQAEMHALPGQGAVVEMIEGMV